MQGKIIKGVGGLYSVQVKDLGVVECSAKGIFRHDGLTPLTGDDVEIELLDEKDMEGHITRICPRKNALIRPAVANIDQALVIFAAAQPDPNFNLLDRFLIQMERAQIPAVLCFNKSDLVTEEVCRRYASVYQASGYPCLFVSARTGAHLPELKKLLQGKCTAVAGPSGAGKSSLINRLQDTVCMETGSISKKLGRGRHTTRHVQLIEIQKDSWIMDTPGFGSLDVTEILPEELKNYYPEFTEQTPCRFLSCMHVKEPDCAVRAAVEAGQISRQRYDNYVDLLTKLKEVKRY